MSAARIAAVHVGRIAPLGEKGVPSAFLKTAVAGPVAVGTLGLDGDSQADPSVHGGPEKAVYAYALSRYPGWAAQFPALAARLTAGAMGENLVVASLDEDSLCVGDVHAIGSAVLQVCQPRQPCFKLALALGEPRAGRHMVRSGHAGWYYRVLAPGRVAAGDAVTLSERPNPGYAFAWLVHIVNFGTRDPDELRALATMPGIASGIAAKARAVLG